MSLLRYNEFAMLLDVTNSALEHEVLHKFSITRFKLNLLSLYIHTVYNDRSYYYLLI